MELFINCFRKQVSDSLNNIVPEKQIYFIFFLNIATLVVIFALGAIFYKLFLFFSDVNMSMDG